MIKKIIFFFFLLIFLGVLEISFFPHFNFFSFLFSPILWMVVLTNIFENPRNNLGCFIAFFGGLFLDFFSSWPIGVISGSFFILALFIKAILKNYVQIPQRT